MVSEPHTFPGEPNSDRPDSIEMPRPTVWPMVLALGLVMLAAGVAFSPAISLIGAALLLLALGGWIVQLLPGQGHFHEPRVEREHRPALPASSIGTVSRLGAGMPGYRLRLPVEMHPVSAGVKGGIVGGLLMPIPALAYGLLSGHGIWYPINLLAGMVLPLSSNPADIEQFHLGLFVAGIVIHAAMCVVFGLLYGVLMPTLPEIPRPIAWGGLLMPLLWTGVSFSLLSIINPVMQQGVDWFWFIVSQFIFGVATAIVVMALLNKMPLLFAAIAGGFVGGLLMALPALLWGRLTEHGIWYPVNLLAGMVIPGLDKLTPAELEQYHPNWLITAIVIHTAMCLVFGLLYGSLLPKLPPIPAPTAWGGLLMPLLWTGASYSLMGVVNPVLEQSVNWPWFILSQFVFGLAASIVVVNSEKVHIAPAGSGPVR